MKKSSHETRSYVLVYVFQSLHTFHFLNGLCVTKDIENIYTNFSTYCIDGKTENMTIRDISFDCDKIDDLVNNKRATVKIKGLRLSIVNSMRRIILTDIPNVAIDTIDIKKNTGILHDEFLKDRISLIPVCFDQEYVDRWNSQDDTSYSLKLKVDASSNIDKYENVPEDPRDFFMKSVHSRDFTVFSKDRQISDELRDRLFPKDPVTDQSILITKLKRFSRTIPSDDNKKGEELEAVCTLRKSTAREHSRWCCVSQCSTVYDGDEDDRIIDFTVESICRMTPAYLIQKSITILRDRLCDCAQRLTKNGTSSIIQTGDDNLFFQFMFDNELDDHTVLNVIQDDLVSHDRHKDKIEYAGYHETHPLEHKMVLKIKFIKNMGQQLTKEDALEYVVESIKWICDNILTNTLLKSWHKFMNR